MAATIAAAILAMTSPAAAAVIINIAPNGTDTPGCGAATSPCLTIPFGYAQAVPGDTIMIAAGTHINSGLAANANAGLGLVQAVGVSTDGVTVSTNVSINITGGTPDTTIERTATAPADVRANPSASVGATPHQDSKGDQTAVPSRHAGPGGEAPEIGPPTLADEHAEVASAVATPAGTQLAATGSQVEGLAVAGVALCALGTLSCLIARRRRAPGAQDS